MKRLQGANLCFPFIHHQYSPTIFVVVVVVLHFSLGSLIVLFFNC